MKAMDKDSNELPRLKALETYVSDIPSTARFWARHFGLEPATASPGLYRCGDIEWRMLPGAQPCGTRGPHGALPGFGIDDFGAARGYLRDQDIPIVFEEMLPGLSLLIFLDPDGSPIELMQTTDPGAWDIRDRRELRTRRRQDMAPAGPLRLGPLQELSIYTHDVSASGRFYRDVLGFPAGLSFFGHIHLVAGNVPLVLRATNWRCVAPEQRHATEPVFTVRDIDALAGRVASAGYQASYASANRLDITDPVGLRLHIEREDA